MKKSSFDPLHLYFHRVSPGELHYTNMEPSLFEDVIDELRESYTLCSVREARRAWLAGEFPAKPHLILSFDDGFADILDHAVPVLQGRGSSATFFIVSGLVGQTSSWGHYSDKARPLPLMDTKALGDLIKSGFEVGAHSHSHRRLVDLDKETLLNETTLSKARLEDLLSCAIECFAYPFGVCDASSRREVESVFPQSFRTHRVQGQSWESSTHGLRRVFIPNVVRPGSAKSALLTAWEKQDA